MTVRFHKTFNKQFRKLRPTEKQKAMERFKLFSKEQFHPILNNHALKGKYQGRHSINITGDYRALYKLVNPDTALFVDIDTHSNLYK